MAKNKLRSYPSKNGIEPVLEKLVAAGADLAIPIKDGRTLKDVAYESGNIGLYNYITKHTH